LTDFLPPGSGKKDLGVGLFPERRVGKMKVFKIHADNQPSEGKDNHGKGTRNVDLFYICNLLDVFLPKDTSKKVDCSAPW
jgi:hypothetical protein